MKKKNGKIIIIIIKKYMRKIIFSDLWMKKKAKRLLHFFNSVFSAYNLIFSSLHATIAYFHFPSH